MEYLLTKGSKNGILYWNLKICLYSFNNKSIFCTKRRHAYLECLFSHVKDTRSTPYAAAPPCSHAQRIDRALAREVHSAKCPVCGCCVPPASLVQRTKVKNGGGAGTTKCAAAPRCCGSRRRGVRRWPNAHRRT